MRSRKEVGPDGEGGYGIKGKGKQHSGYIIFKKSIFNQNKKEETQLIYSYKVLGQERTPGKLLF